MHSSNNKNQAPYMFFSRNLTEKKTDFLSLYFDQDQWGQLFELVQEYDSFQLLKQSADNFLLRIGQHEFKVSRDFHRCMITMGNISTLQKGGAEPLAKIADLLFHDRKHRFMLETSDPKHEKMLWDQCFDLKIPIKPADKAQSERFQQWATHKGIQNKATLGFGQTAAVTSDAHAQATPKSK